MASAVSIAQLFVTGKDLLIEALKYHLLKPEQKRIYQSPRTRPRLPIGLPKVFQQFLFAFKEDLRYYKFYQLIQVLLVVGGQSPKAIRGVECYDFETERWCPLAEMPTRRCR